MSEPGAPNADDDDAVEHAHRGSTFDADEGDPGGGAAFTDDSDSPEEASEGEAREHGYGYE